MFTLPAPTDNITFSIDSPFRARLNFDKTGPVLDEKGRPLNGGTLAAQQLGSKMTKIWVETPDSAPLVADLGQNVAIQDLTLIVGTAKDGSAKFSFRAEKVTPSAAPNLGSPAPKAPVSS